MREKIGITLMKIGFAAFLIFGSALDGPGNDMRVVYGGIIAGLIVLIAGTTMARAWN